MLYDALKRREFLRWLATAFSFVFLGCIEKDESMGQEQKASTEGDGLDDRMAKDVIKDIISKVYVIKTGDRISGVRELLKYFDLDGLSGKRVAIKANYNSADPFPASTHYDTLSVMVDVLNGNKAHVVLAERSGMGNTKTVLEDLGVMELAEKKEFDVVVLDDLAGSDWVSVIPAGSHWKRGFLFPKIFGDADAIVQTCCLKTHRYGGHFTMSLKNSVGMVAKFDPDDGYNYMSELHRSRHQRRMIAEVNTAYEPEFVIMDGISGFAKGGPDTGTLIEPGIMLASRDRVALDAVGVAVLRLYGTTREVLKGDIFELEQIARAVELGLGVGGADRIEMIAINDEAQEICSRIEELLRKEA